jgi:uncharacterized membrane protein
MQPATPSTTPVKPNAYWRLGVTLTVAIIAAKFILLDALPYFGFSQERFGRYWDFRWELIGHIGGGLIALLIGPFQFWKSFRNRYWQVHRNLGKIYLVAILLSCICSTYLAWTSAYRINFSWAFALQGLAFAWFVTTGMAYIAVRRRRFNQHREWMTRSYIVTFAFVTFRLFSDLPITISLMPHFEERGPTVIWMSWTVPLLIAEIFISWKRK